MRITASFSENVVTDNYKTRTFSCVLEEEVLDNHEEAIIKQYDILHVLCVKSVRESIRGYIASLKDLEILNGGAKVQYVQMKGERYKK